MSNPQEDFSTPQDLEIKNFPEKFADIYKFSGPQNGGLIYFFNRFYESSSREQQSRLIRFFTNHSVINFIKLFCDNLRRQVISEKSDRDEREIDRQMAHRTEILQMLLDPKVRGNQDKFIALIEKTGMHEDGAIFDREKYLDIQDIVDGKELSDYENI